MKSDGVVRISRLLTTSVVILAALYYSRAIMAPVTFTLFIVAIAWPLQSALQARIPKLLALVVTIVVTLAIIAVLVLLVVWGFGLVFQWLVNNTDRFQTLYAQATEWLDSHGVSISGFLAESYNPGWIISTVREVGSRSYGLITFSLLPLLLLCSDYSKSTSRGKISNT